MHDHPAQRAVAAATLALLAGVACLVAFLPPMAQHLVNTTARTLLLGAAMAVALLAHWVFVGLAAARMHRSVAFWVGLSALLFPIGSITAVLLLGWQHGRDAQAQPS